ncbi:MAG: CtsR family transcriptional regulator [Synergistaceae bacterium]|nr:CtsR family transcriptional regulator [Synergistaceae bacterium]
MRNLSRHIERYILGLFEDEENSVRLRRKELAEKFGCVPSQINYVLRSRFGPERGYLIESRRGEYGYIKIFRITYDDPEEKTNHVNDLVGDEISVRDACRLVEILTERRLLTERERLLIEIALKHDAKDRDSFSTAQLLKKMLNNLIQLEFTIEE